VNNADEMLSGGNPLITTDRRTSVYSCCSAARSQSSGRNPKRCGGKEAQRVAFQQGIRARAGSASGTFGLSVHIDAYGTDDEIAQLTQRQRDKGSDELLNAVSKLKSNGRLSPTGRVGTEVKVIGVRGTEKGRRILLVTDRRISLVELYKRTRSRDYEFGLVQLES